MLDPRSARRLPPLTPEAAALLPADHDAPRCAAHAAAIGADPGGTAICANAVALVETPLPWAKPVFTSGLLEGLAPMMELHVGATRVLAVVPPDRHSESRRKRDEISVTLHWRSGAGTSSVRYIACGPEGLRGLFGHLAHRMPTDSGPDSGGFTAVGCAENESAVLICTQGSHDVCCGSEGARLAADLESLLRTRSKAPRSASGGSLSDAPLADHQPTDPHQPPREAPAETDGRVAVYRVSHTGGHRFAPTAMTLPDGRMWAGIDAHELAAIVNRSAVAADLAPRCRGWWGASTGPAQVGERAVFAQVGWPLEAMAREVRSRCADDGWKVDVIVSCAGRAWTVTVREGRTVPTIACRAAGGVPAKPATEFVVTDIVTTDLSPSDPADLIVPTLRSSADDITA